MSSPSQHCHTCRHGLGDHRAGGEAAQDRGRGVQAGAEAAADAASPSARPKAPSSSGSSIAGAGGGACTRSIQASLLAWLDNCPVPMLPIPACHSTRSPRKGHVHDLHA